MRRVDTGKVREWRTRCVDRPPREVGIRFSPHAIHSGNLPFEDDANKEETVGRWNKCVPTARSVSRTTTGREARTTSARHRSGSSTVAIGVGSQGLLTWYSAAVHHPTKAEIKRGDPMRMGNMSNGQAEHHNSAV